MVIVGVAPDLWWSAPIFLAFSGRSVLSRLSASADHIRSMLPTPRSVITRVLAVVGFLAATAYFALPRAGKLTASSIPTVTLNNGLKMPIISAGLWEARKAGVEPSSSFACAFTAFSPRRHCLHAILTRR